MNYESHMCGFSPVFSPHVVLCITYTCTYDREREYERPNETLISPFAKALAAAPVYNARKKRVYIYAALYIHVDQLIRYIRRVKILRLIWLMRLIDLYARAFQFARALFSFSVMVYGIE